MLCYFTRWYCQYTERALEKKCYSTKKTPQAEKKVWNKKNKAHQKNDLSAC
jgi:hypothetical protein